MKYLLVIDYPYYTTKTFFEEDIVFECDKNVLAAKLFALKSYQNNFKYEIDILQLNINLI